MPINAFRILLWVLASAAALSCHAQEYISIRGKVVDEATQKAIPYASIQIINRPVGTSANELGEFIFRMEMGASTDSLVISSIGYKSSKIPAGQVSRYQMITLKPAVTELKAVTVQGESALDLMKRVLAKITETFDTTEYHMSAFYRENTFMGKDELLYNEGVLDIRKSFKVDLKNPTDQIRVIKSRKKNIDLSKGGVLYYSMAGVSNGPRFTLGDDMVKYRNMKFSPFNPTQFKYYNFEYDGIIRDGERTLVAIAIKPRKKSKKGLFDMKVFVDEDAEAIVRCEYALTEAGVRHVEKKDKGFGYALMSVAYGVSLDYHRFLIKCAYQQSNDKWYLSSVMRHFEILVNSRKRNMKNTLWKSDMLLQVTDIDTEDKTPITDGNIGDKQDRFGTLANDEYDESFWENYNFVKSVVPDSLMQQVFAPDTASRRTHPAKSSKPGLYYNNQASFTRADTLQGELTPLRSCYDVTFYHLDVAVDLEDRSVRGSNLIRYRVVNPFEMMQVDLYANMKIDSILHRGKRLSYTREENAVFISFPKTVREGEDEVTIFYGGVPKVPDWDVPMNGGIIWDKDENGNTWAQVVCQGSGASLWWPNKDHLSDEPDSARIWITIPDDYTEISNGRLRKTTPMPRHRMRYAWEVSYPINNYNITFNIGKYVHFRDLYITNDTLTIDYYVMPYHRALADTVFAPVKGMLAVFEKYFGKYPFPRDGFTLVESLYPMEHQSGVCVGKLTREATQYFPLMWHESAHEWWGNAISCRDMADMWFHEAFATYAEGLMIEHEFGKEQATNFLVEQAIANKYPIVGVHDVNHIFYDIGDMYGKGSRVLHTLRKVLDSDSLWFDLLRGIQQRFRYTTLSSDELIAFISDFTGRDFTAFFDHYLKKVELPELHVRHKQEGSDVILEYRWQKTGPAFSMPVKVTTAPDHFSFIYPTGKWQTMTITNLDEGDFEIDEHNFLIDVVEE